MRLCRLFLFLVLSFVLLTPGIACAQQAGEPILYSYTLKTDQLLNCYGISEGDRLVSINMAPEVNLHGVLVIQGSGSDIFEQNGFSSYCARYPLNSALTVGDGATSFYGKNIMDYYDLILIGGPEHNAYTRELVDQGILTCKGTSVKMPGMVLEAATTPQGHTVVVIGDVSGYPFHKKDLPLNNVIPESIAPAAAIALGMGLGILGVLLNQSSHVISLKHRAMGFALRFLNAPAAEASNDPYAGAAAKPGTRKGRRIMILGHSVTELMAIGVCPIIFSIAFIIADRVTVDAGTMLIFLIMGFLVLIAHDLGHRLVAQKVGIEGEYHFWGLGSITLLLTAWLFGIPFAQPGKFKANPGEQDQRNIAFITLAGPAVNFLMALAFLPFALVGGVAGQIGVLGFSMNIVTVVYNLMPFSPMDGKEIYDWSKIFWALIFVPLALFFIVMMVVFI